MTIYGDTIGKVAPNIDIGAISSVIGTGLTVFLVFLVVVIIGGGIGYVIVQGRIWNQRVTVFRKVRGRTIAWKRYKARHLKVGDTGEVLLELQTRPRLRRSAYSETIDKNTYGFFINKNEDWIPFGGFGDLNLQGDLELLTDNAGMKLIHSGLRRNTERNFGEKKSWIKENIGLMVGGIVLIVIVVFLWLYADKMLGVIGQAGNVMDSANKVLLKEDNILAHLDNICSGGSGIKPAVLPV